LAEDFTIIGAGAIGAIVGAHLTRAGRSIAFIEANADHVAAIRGGGLRLSGALDATIHPPVLLPREVSGKLRHVLLAGKARHTEAAPGAADAVSRPDGVVFHHRTGWEPKIAALAGADRTIGAFLTFGGHYCAPGDVVFGGPAHSASANWTAASPIDCLHCAKAACGAEVEVTANIAGYPGPSWHWARSVCHSAGQRRRDGAVRPAEVPRHVRRTRR
jgi:ketopantoate reductase